VPTRSRPPDKWVLGAGRVASDTLQRTAGVSSHHPSVLSRDDRASLGQVMSSATLSLLLPPVSGLRQHSRGASQSIGRVGSPLTGQLFFVVVRPTGGARRPRWSIVDFRVASSTTMTATSCHSVVVRQDMRRWRAWGVLQSYLRRSDKSRLIVYLYFWATSKALGVHNTKYNWSPIDPKQ